MEDMQFQKKKMGDVKIIILFGFSFFWDRIFVLVRDSSYTIHNDNESWIKHQHCEFVAVMVFLFFIQLP